MSRGRLKQLVDDFPRRLTPFETDKIARQLGFAAKVDIIPDKPKHTPKAMDKASLLLSNVHEWPLATSVRVFSELDVHEDARFVDFVARAVTCKDQLNVQSILQLLNACHSSQKMHVPVLLAEVVLNRELRGLDRMQYIRVAEIAVETDEVQVLRALSIFADSKCDVQLHLALLPYRFKQGELGLPLNMFPVLSTTDLVQLLTQLCACEFPDVMGSAIAEIADCLSRLSFHRLTSSQEKAVIQSLLFKLKMKLDRMTYIDNNPFYTNRFLKKVTRSLSNNFQEIATTVPLGLASGQMLELIGLNALSLHSVDTIAGRIESFGESLFAGITGAEFTNIVWALTHHPQGRKRVDKLRASVATQLAGGFQAHLPAMRVDQIVSCCSSLMLIHNSTVRLVVGAAISDKIADIRLLPIEDKLVIVNIYAVLLKKRNFPIDPMIKLFESVDLTKLTMPQLVGISSVTVKFLPYCSNQVVTAIETRLQNGGSVSLTNTVKLLESLSKMNPSADLVAALIGAMPPVESPLMAAKLVSIFSSFDDPDIVRDSLPFIEEQLLLLADPDNWNVVAESPLCLQFEASLDALGETGASFKQVQLLST